MSLKFKIFIGFMIVAFAIQSYLLHQATEQNDKLLMTNQELAEELQRSREINNLFNSESMGEHVLTFYTHTGNRTASGVYPKAGRTVAVDTNYIPHGTLLYIEGIGFRIAEDTGGDIKGNRLDVFVDTKEEAIKKGVKKAKVHVIKGKK